MFSLTTDLETFVLKDGLGLVAIDECNSLTKSQITRRQYCGKRLSCGSRAQYQIHVVAVACVGATGSRFEVQTGVGVTYRRVFAAPLQHRLDTWSSGYLVQPQRLSLDNQHRKVASSIRCKSF